MLTEQNVIMELTDSSDTLPIGFITTDDGHTLLAVGEHEDGTLEFMATPVALMPQNNMVSPALIKTMDGSFILHPPVFQLNVEGLPGTVMQQTNLLPLIQHFGSENGSAIMEQLKVQDTNECTVTESLLSKDNSNVLSDKGQSTVDNAKSESSPVSMIQNVYKRSPGRPKKTGVTSQNTQSLKCDICRQEFTKQSLYRRHMDNHAEEKPHRCPKCPASFNIPTNFTLHMATHNIGDPKCPECGRKYARMASLKSHMLLHEKEENLFCTECEDAFSTKAQLDAHLKLHGEKWASEDMRKCKLCNKQFMQPALYRLHIREHYRLQTKIVKQTKRGTKHKTMYKCTICLKTFQKPSQLMRHIRVHTGEKPFKCTICNRAFTQKSSLQIHTWQHKGIRPHTCSLCNAKFSQKGNLKAHILRVHNAPEGEPTYACSYCSCIFKKLGSLNGHIKRMHSVSSEESAAKSSEANPNISSEADMRATVDSVISQLASLESVVNNTVDSTKTTTLSADQNDILQQALKNSGLPNKNEVISKETAEPKKPDSPTSYVTLLDRTAGGTSRKYLTIKQRCIGNVRWYACSFCPKEFKKPSDLIRHLRVHTQEKPFKCMYCVRSFALKSTMIAHERTHTGVKKYACDSCDKTFACHSSLTAHTRLHTKPHKCNICDKSFSASTLLKNHMKSHTREKPKISPEAESLVPQVVLQEPLVISDAGNKISVAQVQSKQKQLYESVGVARPHECWICHAAFRKVSHLKQHVRRHTGERPYKCSKCDRRFTSNSVLKSHLHTHDDARPYSCTVCDTKFSTQSSMKRHLVTHSNKRPYMCPYCHKTFKTYVSCRKHMKRHKHELAQRQLEEQKMQDQKEPQPLSDDKGVTSALPESITLTEDMEVSFQPQMAPDFTQAFSDQFQNISAEKEKSFLLSDNATPSIVNQNLSVDTTNLGTSQTLHADETGTITLPHYSGDQTLTPESIREIEETLNQQLFNIGMNLGLGANNLPRQMDEANTNSLNNSREQPVLNIIYEHNKTLESASNTIFMSQFDSFDMNQITLQTDNDIDIGLNPSNSTNMSSILPRSVGSNQQEEQRAAPITTASNIDASQITRNTHLVVINPKENCSELMRFSQVCPSKYSKVIAKADTTNGLEMQSVSEHEKAPQKNNVMSCENERNPLFMKNFQSTMQLKTLVSSDMDSSTKISESNTLLQCHMCGNQGFTTERLKEHLKSHRGSKEYECSECSQRFCTNGGLSRHMKMHTNKQRWKCTTCQKILGSKLQLKFHSKIHTEVWNVSSMEPDSSQKDLISSNSSLPTITTLDVRVHPNPSVSEKVLMDTVAERKSMDHADENVEKKETKEYTNKCKYCPKTFRKPSDLIRHIRTHTGERPYKCDHCSKSFAVKCTLDSHMKVHTGKKTFCCHVCSSMFATKGSLKVHMRLHTGSKPFKCPVCDLRFRTSGHKKVHMLKHMREHKGGTKRKPKHSKIAAVAEAAASLEKIGQNSLENAPMTMTTATAMNDATGPSQNLDYPALEQTVNLDTTIHLPNQITFNHTDATTTILNNNSMLSVNENNELVANLQFLLANGLVTIQTDDTLLTQPVANSSDATGLPTNVIELVNPDPFQEACNLDNSNHVMSHVINSQMPTEITADTSNATVIQMNNCVPPVSMVQMQTQDANGAGVSETKMSDQTTTTMATAKASTQPSRKECDICGKTFMKPYQMERHKRIHTGERPYKCEQCGKSFAQKFTLQLHQKHHTGDRPYSCPHCKHLFTQKCNLQTHLKRVHEVVMLDVKKLKSGQQMLGALLQDNQGGDTKLLNLDDILVVDFLK